MNQRIASLDIHSSLYLRTRKNRYYGGDIGDLYLLVDKAAEAGFGLIQLNPIQDTNKFACPYMGVSIFSFNPVHLDPDQLPTNPSIESIKKDWIKQASMNQSEIVDYHGLYKFKETLLRLSFHVYKKTINFEDFNHNILAYATFIALRNKYRCNWPLWPEKFKSANIERIIEENSDLHSDIAFVLYSQAVLRDQWTRLIHYAAKKKIRFIIDKPIYPMHESADVWANQELFYLNEDGSLQYLSGCNNPGDPFGEQVWGHAVYRFKAKPEEVIDYFAQCVKHLSEISPVIRLDNTLSLIWKYYLIDTRTKNGRHWPALSHELFDLLDKKFPSVQFIAEDVGFVSEELITDPLAKHNIPGMRCLQWSSEKYHTDTQNYPELCVALTSNHDIDSLPRWWKNLDPKTRSKYYQELGVIPLSDEETIWRLIELVFRSKANFASVTLRDLIFDMRSYNLPGTKRNENWRNHMPSYLEEVDFGRIKRIIKESDRNS